MNFTYLFRAPSNNVSIERVFESVISGIENINSDIHVDRVYASSGKGLIITMIRNMIHCRKHCNGIINHITGDVHYCSLLMPAKNTVLTIHDMVSLHNSTTPKLVKWFVWLFWYYLPLKKLKYVTCISQATYDDIISSFPWAKQKIQIIPNPVGAEFRHHGKKINTQYPRILHIGTRENKNLNKVIEALADMPCHLRIIGLLSPEQSLLLKRYKIDYSNTNNLSDEEIVQEYVDCDIVSFPSTFEGFGMPIIEAQAVGRPVVTSNIEPMLSVAGSGAALVNPFDVEDIRNGFATIIGSEKYAQEIVAMGLKNATKYSVATIATRYQSLYHEMIINNQ